jgi:Ca2+-binding EF-hand superfamily protein
VNYITLAEIQMLVKYFDSDSDGFLNYQEFMQVMLPCDDMYLRSAATQRPNYPISPTAFLHRTVEKDLTELLEREIRWHTKLESRKHELMKRYDWSASGAFNVIDFARIGHIEHRHVADFLKKNGYYATEAELIAIIRRLDVDAD